MTKLPLEGVRVLDITVVIGAPYGMMLLAAMGAEVIRVESTHLWQSTTRGNLARPPKAYITNMGPVGSGYPDLDPGERPWNRFALFNTHAHNKLSMTVDLKKPKGTEIFKRLVKVSDVVVQNNAPGVFERLGLGYDVLKKVKEDIILLSLSGMGQTGPYKENRGYGGHFEDVIGHTWLRGYPEDNPLSSTGCVASDPAVGAALVWATVAALHHRNRTGKGQYMDMSMGEVFMHHLSSAFLDYTMNGRSQRTIGNRHRFMAPHGCYECKGDDKWAVIAVGSDEEWRAMCNAMGHPEWAGDERFKSTHSRWQHQNEMDCLITGWTRQRSPKDVQDALQKSGVTAGAVVPDPEIVNDPHLSERGFYVRVTHPEAGTHDYPFRLWQMSKTPLEVRRPPPLLGEHNEYVYKKILKVSDEEFAQLTAEGHIGTELDADIP